MTDYLHALSSGYRIEEYELVRVLGSGGFGITYLGYDHHLDKAVAIKEYLPNDLAVRTDNQSVLPTNPPGADLDVRRTPVGGVPGKAHIKSTQDKADYEWGLERFLNEAQTLARFDHRHLIRIHRFFRAHGTGYSVMEYAEGETLSEGLQRKGTLTEAELKAILFPILDGLEAVHEADFLHRDIKPSNIVIREDGSPVLIDFGSARQAVAGKSRSVTAIVTPGYAPIEQYSAKGHQGPWTDIYGLGAVCYRCLTGEAPGDATERLREDSLVPASKRCKGKSSASLLDAIDRALQVDEGERPQTITEWGEILSNKTATPAYRGRKDTAKPTTQPASSPSQGSKDGLLSKLLLTGVVVALVGSGVYWWFAEVRQSAAAREAAGEMIPIPGDTFRMGDLSGVGYSMEQPVHSVTIRPFRMGKYEVTFAQWDACVADGGCGGYQPDDEGWGRGNRPVINVSWDDAQSFIAWLNGRTEGGYRLPTEAEWEYAARAGSTTKYHFGNDESQLCRYANHADTSMDSMWRNESCSDGVDKRTAEVGRYQPNGYGIYDMHGNVWEWVEDCWHYNYEGAPSDGGAWTSSCQGALGDENYDDEDGGRGIRGDSWRLFLPGSLRSAARSWNPRAVRDVSLGFRLAQD